MKIQLDRALGLKSLLFVVLVHVTPVTHAEDIFGRVVSVSDGDTLTVLSPTKQRMRIRMDSIDAPEKGQPYGQAAQNALAYKVAGKNVLVKSSDTDRYGRTIGVVMLDERNINREMVAEGHAWVYRQYLRDNELLRLETTAKEEGLGLWRLPPHERHPPWEWRRKKNTKARTPPSPIPQAASPACGSKRFCREMSNCEEAKFYLLNCGRKLDGDGDGIPCEALCREPSKR